MIRNNILILLTLILASLPGRMSADSPEDIEAQMDRVKLDETMIYGEDFSDNKDLAYDNALAELLVTANELRAEEDLQPLEASELKPAAKELRYTKGTRHVVLLYMPKVQMMKIHPKMHADTPTPTPPKKDPPAAPTTPAPSPSAVTPAADEIIEILCGQDNWIEIKGFITRYKQEGKIKATGAVDSASEPPADAYSILIDEFGGILAILSPMNGGQRIDYRTNRPDNESNHSNCKFIFWYK
ncbi:MAG: hypothetical protein K2H38_00900 [Muribaculaceae bacterium]|nr:hypothetical protein [Muribaculaceae bacterium]